MYKVLGFEDRALVESECKNCVKFRGDHCLVLREFFCLNRNGEGCPAKETNIHAWKKTLEAMLRYNAKYGSYHESDWVAKELERLERITTSEVNQCRLEDERRPIKRGKSESGRDKSYKRGGSIGGSLNGGFFPDLNR